MIHALMVRPYQCFTLKEIVLIINVLIIKFRLECNIHKQDNYYVIYIKSKSLKKNLHHMLPYIHPSMLYKFQGHKYKLKSKFTTTIICPLGDIIPEGVEFRCLIIYYFLHYLIM